MSSSMHFRVKIKDINGDWFWSTDSFGSFIPLEFETREKANTHMQKSKEKFAGYNMAVPDMRIVKIQDNAANEPRSDSK